MDLPFKKVFMIIVITLFYYTVIAQQRICDREPECIYPSDTVINGNRLPLRFGMKNLGPDVMLSQDTTLYMVYKVLDGRQEFIYQGPLNVYKGDEIIGVGESNYYYDLSTILFHYPDRTEPFIVDFCVRLDSWMVNNWGDTIRFSYFDPNDENNTCCKQVVVMPKPAEPTNIEEKSKNAAEDYNIYPNPAREILYIQTKEKRVRGELLVIVWDLTGRILLEHRYSESQVNNGAISLNVQQLPEGILGISLQSETNTVFKIISIIR